MFDETLNLLKNKKQGRQYFSSSAIYVLERMLEVNLNPNNISDELAYTYFKNIGLDIPFYGLTYAKNLYKDKIFDCLNDKFNNLLFNIFDYVFSINREEEDFDKKAVSYLKVEKTFYKTLKDIYKIDFSNTRNNITKGLVDGFYQTIKSRINNPEGDTTDRIRWIDDITLSNKFQILSENEIVDLKFFLLNSFDNPRNIKVNNIDLYTNSMKIKTLLIILYSSEMSDNYFFRDFKDFQNRNRTCSLEDYVLAEYKAYRNNLLQVVNNFKDISLETALMINPNVEYHYLHYPEKWNEKTFDINNKGRDFMFMLWELSITVQNARSKEDEDCVSCYDTTPPKTIGLES